MDISLIINGAEKKFSAPFIPARMLKETFKLSKELETKDPDETMIDTMVNYIVKLFGKKFTDDQLLDGMASDQLIPTFTNCITQVTGQLNEKLEPLQDPNAKAGQ